MIKVVHGGKYSYTNVVLSGNKKVKISCVEHGEFKQSPNTQATNMLFN